MVTRLDVLRKKQKKLRLFVKKNDKEISATLARIRMKPRATFVLVKKKGGGTTFRRRRRR